MYNNNLATLLATGSIAINIIIPKSAYAEALFWKEILTGIPTNEMCDFTADREWTTTPPNSDDPQDASIDPEYSTKDSVDRQSIEAEVIYA